MLFWVFAALSVVVTLAIVGGGAKSYFFCSREGTYKIRNPTTPS